MANISKEKMFLKGGGEWYKIITYSKGMFRIKLPDIMCKDLNLKEGKDIELTGHSEQEVNSKFNTKMKEWTTAIEIITKVIIFKSEFQGALAKESFKSRWADGYTPSYKQSGISDSREIWEFIAQEIDFNSTSLGLTIQWAIYEKKEVKGKFNYKFLSGRYFDNYDLSRNELRTGMIEIDHTEEREKFFLELDESFARMISKVHKALGDLTPAKLSMLAESKMKLLSN